MPTSNGLQLRRIVATLVTICLVVVQAAWTVAPSQAGDPAGDLKQIQYRHYYRGQYGAAVGALQTYLARTDLDADHTRSAREFLAASWILSGDPAAGRDVFVGVLNEQETYAGPDPAVFKPEVIAVYSEARDIVASARLRSATAPDQTAAAFPPTKLPIAEGGGKPIYKKWWFYAGTAATLLLVAGAASSGKDGEKIVVPDKGSVSVGVTVR